MIGLSGKRIVVFGAGGVLGEAVCERLLQEDVAVLGAYDLRPDSLRDSSADSGARARIVCETVDVSDAESVAAALDHFVAFAGGVDVVINNAGIMPTPATVERTDPDLFLKAMRVNLLGVVHGTQSALRHMKPHRSGSIINTASVAATTGWALTAPYSASKAAILQLTRTAALEGARHGIRVNSVSPGTFLSPFHAEVDPGALQRLIDRHPLGRLASASEVAGAYVYLASEDSSFVTGTDLKVDGGLSAR